MSFPAPRACELLQIWIATVLLAATLAGCNAKPTTSAEQEADVKFDNNPKSRMLPVAKFAGKVTVDGQPPKKDGKLFVILTDSKHLDEHASGQLPKLYAVCNAEGSFAFGTYDLKNGKDGVFTGKYVVTFVQLHKYSGSTTKAGRPVAPGSSRRPQTSVKYALPDDLKNLYSDPDTNVKDKRFKLDLQPPGKDDYQFNLAVIDKDPVAKAAPHAVTYMVLH
jgi:hypothetical protein